MQSSTLKSGRSKSCGCLRPVGSQWTPEQHREAKRKWRKARPEYRAAESRRWRLADPERFKRKHREQNFRRKYGLELWQVGQMYVAQGGRCAICADEAPFGGKGGAHVDHCHGAGHVRAILCNRCNTGLGQFRDKPELLRAAATYLERHGLRAVAG